MKRSKKTVENSSTTSDETGIGGELHRFAGQGEQPLSTNQGLSISDNQNSLRLGQDGPVLLEDFILREKIMHFDHERIPERIVHARGTGLRGYFELTKSLEEYTTATVLTNVGAQTPVFARFSTVAGGAGSADTPRDVRGFAVKFYTLDGNWDLVGNNIPVFFIQDAMKFPDLIHAVKMEPDRGFPQAASAHDTFWDFISLMPEAMHTLMWVMSDRALPRSLRMMDGFGVHSFRLINSEGQSTFVKFHWRTVQGLQSQLWDEAVKTSGADPDFHRRDLWDSIQRGKYPEWDLCVQLFTENDAKSFAFDHLDPTKLIPEEIVPLVTVGRMVLNKYPDNFFAETEQVAFCPGNLIPGIEFSNDPLLQGRLFSYLDTQLSRLGSPNSHQIPVNAPVVPVQNFQRDGHMQGLVPQGRVNYEPSTLDRNVPRQLKTGFRNYAARQREVQKGRSRPESFADHYTQARMFWQSQSEHEQAHIASAFVFELAKVQTKSVRDRVIGHLRVIDEELARRVGRGLGLAQLPDRAVPAVEPEETETFPSLQLIGNMKATLKGRSVGIVICDGSSANAVTRIRKAVENAEANVTIIAPKLEGILLDDQSVCPADGLIAGTPSVLLDAVALLLTDEAGRRLASESAVVDFVRDAFGHLKAFAVDDGGHALLATLGIDDDEFIIDASDTTDFIAAAMTRLWSREPAVRTLA